MDKIRNKFLLILVSFNGQFNQRKSIFPKHFWSKELFTCWLGYVIALHNRLLLRKYKFNKKSVKRTRLESQVWVRTSFKWYTSIRCPNAQTCHAFLCWWVGLRSSRTWWRFYFQPTSSRFGMPSKSSLSNRDVYDDLFNRSKHCNYGSQWSLKLVIWILYWLLLRFRKHHRHALTELRNAKTRSPKPFGHAIGLYFRNIHNRCAILWIQIAGISQESMVVWISVCFLMTLILVRNIYEANLVVKHMKQDIFIEYIKNN